MQIAFARNLFQLQHVITRNFHSSEQMLRFSNVWVPEAPTDAPPIRLVLVCQNLILLQTGCAFQNEGSLAPHRPSTEDTLFAGASRYKNKDLYKTHAFLFQFSNKTKAHNYFVIYILCTGAKRLVKTFRIALQHLNQNIFGGNKNLGIFGGFFLVIYCIGENSNFFTKLTAEMWLCSIHV